MEVFVHVNDYENIKELIQNHSWIDMPEYTKNRVLMDVYF